MNKNNILSAKQIADGLKRNQLTPDELKRIADMDVSSSMNIADLRLLAKYNAYVLYKNASLRSQYEAEVDVVKESGPISSYQPTETYEEEGFLSPTETAAPYVAADTGELYNIFEGKSDLNNINDATFVFTDEGVLPLSEEGERLLKNYSIKEGGPLNVMFNLEGDSEEYYGRNKFPVFTKYGTDPEPELPKGVVRGIPEGENKEDYISVGVMRAEPKQLANGMTEYAQLQGDPYLYIKRLDRQPQIIQRERPVGDPVPIYPSMPEEPEYLKTIDIPEQERTPVTNDSRKPEPPEPEIIPETDRRPVHPEPPDPILKEDTEDDLVVQKDHIDKPKDPLFTENLLANIAKGLEGWNLEGANIPVPSYDQPRYASGELGLAIQNFYRGGN